MGEAFLLRQPQSGLIPSKRYFVGHGLTYPSGGGKGTPTNYSISIGDPSIFNGYCLFHLTMPGYYGIEGLYGYIEGYYSASGSVDRSVGIFDYESSPRSAFKIQYRYGGYYACADTALLLIQMNVSSDGFVLYNGDGTVIRSYKNGGSYTPKLFVNCQLNYIEVFTSEPEFPFPTLG